MLAKKLFIALATAGLASLTASQSWALTATTSTSPVTTSTSKGVASEELASQYSKLAGSTANAQSLVIGLRTGTLVTLTPSATAPAGTPVISFTPATQKMGYGNINITLALAKTTLAKQGITNPTPEQLAAALNGGKITLANGTVVTMTGILTQRSAGMGWGKIAKSMGVKLGAVVSASKTDKAGKKATFAKTDDDSKKETTLKTVKVEKTEKEDKKDTLAKADDAKNHSAGSTKSSSSSSGSGGGSGSSNGGGGGGGSHGGGGGGGSSHGGGGGGGGGGGKK